MRSAAAEVDRHLHAAVAHAGTVGVNLVEPARRKGGAGGGGASEMGRRGTAQQQPAARPASSQLRQPPATAPGQQCRQRGGAPDGVHVHAAGAAHVDDQHDHRGAGAQVGHARAAPALVLAHAALGAVGHLRGERRVEARRGEQGGRLEGQAGRQAGMPPSTRARPAALQAQHSPRGA